MKIQGHRNTRAFALLLLGVCLLVYILGTTRQGVFFSGDGGIKYLMVKQFAQGNVSPAIELPSSPETRQLWDNGFYPFGPPFVYHMDDRYIVSFPLFFSVLSTPMYMAFGWRGLYVIPALSLVLTWICMLFVARRYRMGAFAEFAMLFCIVFSSPLLIYGAMFWEHTLGVLLASIPLLSLCGKSNDKAPGRFFFMGLLAGCAVFFRPEALICGAAFLVARFLVSRRDAFKNTFSMSLGFTCSFGVFLAANHLIYGHVLGIHALQTTDQGLFSIDAIFRCMTRMILLCQMLGLVWVPALFAVACVPLVCLRHPRRGRELAICALTLAASIPLIALIAPNDGGKQWGPRYMLVLIPWLTFLFGLGVDAAISIKQSRPRSVTIFCIVTCLVIGAYVNVYHGANILADDYNHRILPVLRELKTQPQKFVVALHQCIIHELAALADEKVFLRAKEPDDIDRVARHLHAMDIADAAFLTYRHYEKFLPEDIVNARDLGRADGCSAKLLNIQSMSQQPAFDPPLPSVNGMEIKSGDKSPHSINESRFPS